jgi:hypothetical protein
MTAENSRLYDLSMVQSVSGGDEGLYQENGCAFYRNGTPEYAGSEKRHAAENWEQVGKTAHKLKSTIDSMGIKSIRQEIRTVEANAKQESLQDHPPLVANIDAVIRECIEQLQTEVLK